MIRRVIKKILPAKAELNNKNVLASVEQRLFFVHIPKTAGSSFRTSFESSTVTYKDYGNNSKSTTNEVQANIHDKKDFYALNTLLNQHNYAWLTGHVPLAKYINFVPVTHTISFVREPLEQVLSHYNHYVKHHGFKGDLSAFLDKPFAKNLQSKCLDFMPLGLLGCLGITEYYDESLALINAQFSLNLPIKKVNVNKTKKFTAELVDAKLKNKFVKNNRLDIAMYNEAKFLHLQRVKLSQENKTWTYGCAAVNQQMVVHGCAFQHKNEQAVSLVVHINDQPFKTIVAKGFYAALVKVNFPRDRYIRFSVPLPKDISSEDVIDVYVEETRQKLNFKPLKINLK